MMELSPIEMCENWIKDYSVSTNYGAGFNYLHAKCFDYEIIF